MKYRVVYLLLLLSSLSCWQRQEHDITRPLIPHYDLTGQAVDMDSGDPLPGIRIQLEEYNMLYEAEFGTLIMTADTLGMFAFDSVYPGSYYLSMERDNFFINKTQLDMPHRDSTLTLNVPSISICYTLLPGSDSQDQVLAVSGTQAIFFIRFTPKYYYLPNILFYVHKYVGGQWTRTDILERYIYTDKIYAMAFGADGLYCSVYPDTFYVYNRSDLQLKTRYQIDKPVHGITFHAVYKAIATCYKSLVQIHDVEKPSQIVETVSIPGSDLRALAYYRGLYAWDTDKELLIQLNDDLEITRHYALIDGYKQAQITYVYDMGFDGYGVLWVNGK